MKELSNKEVFTNICLSNYWGSVESCSGPGSELRQTRVIRNKLPKLIERFGIRTMLDIPCGDFNWMKEVDLSRISSYIGADIVDYLVYSNSIKYGNKNRKFVGLDLTQDFLPRVDLIFCRDCLVHLNFRDIFKSISNIKRSNSTFLLLTHYNKEPENIDTENARWRPINFQISPFNFCSPIFYIGTNFTNNGKQHPGNGMGLWKIADL